MRGLDARTATCAFDIGVTWGDGSWLHQEHVRPARDYVLHDGTRSAQGPGFVVSPEWIGANEHRLIHVEHDVLVVHTLEREIRLGSGEATAVTIGPLHFYIANVAPLSVAMGKTAVEAKDHAWTLASLGVHGLALACMALMPPKASSLSLDLASDDARYLRYLATPVVPDETLPWTKGEGAHGPAEQTEDAARHRGPEGQAGVSTSARTKRRLAIEGNSKVRVAQTTDPEPQPVTEAGILGVLAGAVPTLSASSPFGAKAPLGYDPVTALGALFGNQLGDNFGLNGLGLHGTGRAGGGGAAGTIGIGSLQTGQAARGTPGSHTLGMRARRSFVPVLTSGPVEVRGSLSKEVIRRTIQRHLNEVRFCYQEALQEQPELAGRVVVRFMIAPSGAVQGSKIDHSTLAHRQAESCIRDAVRRWAFPQPDGGGYVMVSYPFVLDAAGS